ncbi:MAG: M48 family metalloprotease [Pseudomonadota bacterium]|nr:M48 family metalloprotease [Pseudomonadota bacterium]
MAHVVRAFILVVFVGLTGCAVNPVTGEREFNIISTEQEILIGQQNYVPAQQMQGGLYTVDPEVTAYVNGIGQQLAVHSERELPYEFVVLNNSVPNAWAMPGGKIAINRGLMVELENEAELAAVIGHEITHAAARHSAKAMERAMVLQAGVALIAVAASSGEGRYAPLWVGGASVAAAFLGQRYSREAELEADYYGMQYMDKVSYDPHAAVTLQETFVRLSEGRESNWLQGLFASHPPSQKRVDANTQHAKELKQGGKVEESAYREQIAQIIKDQPAYAAYDEGVKALVQDEDTTTALAKAQEAVQLQPKEHLFHGLIGFVHLQQSNWQEALKNYEKALALYDGYYQSLVGAGESARQLGQDDKALGYLEQSVELLPTATAHNGIGQILLKQGTRDKAIENLKLAAQSESPAGDEARATLKRLGVAVEQPKKSG